MEQFSANLVGAEVGVGLGLEVAVVDGARECDGGALLVGAAIGFADCRHPVRPIAAPRAMATAQTRTPSLAAGVFMLSPH
jgi:hypothetical protein